MLERRAFLGGLAALPLVAAVPALAATAPGPNDLRLIALADEYEDLDQRCTAHTAAHRHLQGAAMRAAEDVFDALASGQIPLEEEMAETPADTLAGVVAKARACQNPTLRHCTEEVAFSLADDVWRLFGGAARGITEDAGQMTAGAPLAGGQHG